MDDAEQVAFKTQKAYVIAKLITDSAELLTIIAVICYIALCRRRLSTNIKLQLGLMLTQSMIFTAFDIWEVSCQQWSMEREDLTRA